MTMFLLSLWPCAQIEPLPAATVDKLQSAARNRGVVLCTTGTVKSLQLKLLEKMDVLRDLHRKQHPTMEHDVRALAQVLNLFRSGCLIMDEVDRTPSRD